MSPEGAQWDVDTLRRHRGRRYIAFVINEDGRSRLTVIDNTMKLDMAPPGVPDGAHRSRSCSTMPARSWPSRPRPRSRPRRVCLRPRRRTRSSAGPTAKPGRWTRTPSTTPELVHYPTWDRVAGSSERSLIPLYAEDAGAPSRAHRHPWRPEGQYRPGYEAFFQFLVNELGYAVIAPNVRGSSGIRQDVPEAR